MVDTKELTERELDRIIEMAWEDRRKRVNSGVSQKHLKKRNPDITRFKCSRQKAISGNKISKR